MDTKSIIAVIVGVLVSGLILVAFVPVFTEVTATEDTITNNGVYFMTDDDTDYTLEYRGVDGKLIVNGDAIEFSDLPANAWTLVSTPDYMIRFQNWSAQSFNLWLFGIDGYNRVVGSNAVESVTITISSGTISVENVNDFTYSGEFRGIAKTGNYVMTDGSPFTVNETSSIIVGNGTTPVTVWYDLFYMSGTVETMTVTAGESITVSNIVVNDTPLTKYVDGVSVQSITFTATNGENSVNATYDRVIVPYNVTLELSVHGNDAFNSVINIIPMIAGVGLLLGAVAYFLTRK